MARRDRQDKKSAQGGRGRGAQKRRFKRKGLTRHHIVPSSRGGATRGNIVGLPINFHTNWHQVFGNLTLVEAALFVCKVMQPGEEWTEVELEELRQAIIMGRR